MVHAREMFSEVSGSKQLLASPSRIIWFQPKKKHVVTCSILLDMLSLVGSALKLILHISILILSGALSFHSLFHCTSAFIGVLDWFEVIP